jgi:hypothetical protein
MQRVPSLCPIIGFTLSDVCAENGAFTESRSVDGFNPWPSHQLFGNEALEQLTIEAQAVNDLNQCPI